MVRGSYVPTNICECVLMYPIYLLNSFCVVKNESSKEVIVTYPNNLTYRGKQ